MRAPEPTKNNGRSKIKQQHVTNHEYLTKPLRWNKPNVVMMHVRECMSVSVCVYTIFECFCEYDDVDFWRMIETLLSHHCYGNVWRQAYRDLCWFTFDIHLTFDWFFYGYTWVAKLYVSHFVERGHLFFVRLFFSSPRSIRSFVHLQTVDLAGYIHTHIDELIAVFMARWPILFVLMLCCTMLFLTSYL